MDFQLIPTPSLDFQAALNFGEIALKCRLIEGVEVDVETSRILCGPEMKEI